MIADVLTLTCLVKEKAVQRLLACVPWPQFLFRTTHHDGHQVLADIGVSRVLFVSSSLYPSVHGTRLPRLRTPRGKCCCNGLCPHP